MLMRMIVVSLMEGLSQNILKACLMPVYAGTLTVCGTGGWRDETRSRNRQNPEPRRKPIWRRESSRPPTRRVGRNQQTLYLERWSNPSGFRIEISRENPRRRVIGIKANAMRIGTIINNALSIPVKWTIRAAPGNSISHPIRHNPNDQGHKTLRTLCNLEGILLHILSGEFLFNAIRMAIVPRIGGPNPPLVRSIRTRRANSMVIVFLS